MALHDGYDDPRQLRELLSRARDLAAVHSMPTVVVGLAGPEGELLLPELFDYVASALRVEDSIFRMTRERAVLFLTDVEVSNAKQVVERLLHGFFERFASTENLPLSMGFYEITPRKSEPRLKEVLPVVFPADAPRLLC